MHTTQGRSTHRLAAASCAPLMPAAHAAQPPCDERPPRPPSRTRKQPWRPRCRSLAAAGSRCWRWLRNHACAFGATVVSARSPDPTASATTPPTHPVVSLSLFRVRQLGLAARSTPVWLRRRRHGLQGVQPLPLALPAQPTAAPLNRRWLHRIMHRETTGCAPRATAAIVTAATSTATQPHSHTSHSHSPASASALCSRARRSCSSANAFARSCAPSTRAAKHDARDASSCCAASRRCSARCTPSCSADSLRSAAFSASFSTLLRRRLTVSTRRVSSDALLACCCKARARRFSLSMMAATHTHTHREPGEWHDSRSVDTEAETQPTRQPQHAPSCRSSSARNASAFWASSADSRRWRASSILLGVTVAF